MKTFFILILATFGLAGCTHQYYVPNAQNIPLFKKKNQGSLSAGMNMSAIGQEGPAGVNDTHAKSSALYLQGAASFTDRMAGMINFCNITGTGPRGSAGGILIEAAGGYYYPADDRLVLGFFGGAGCSSQHHNYRKGLYGSSKLNFHQEFLQPFIGVTFKGVEFALSSKLSSRTFFIVQFSNDSVPYELQVIKDHPQSLLFEPAITFRFGWEAVKLQVQYAWMAGSVSRPIQEERSLMSLSLHIAIRNEETKK